MKENKLFTWIKENKLDILINVFTIIAIILTPYFISKMVSEKSIIENIETNNDWIGFFGSYSSGIITLIVLWFTRRDTRKIQEENNRLMKLDKQKILADEVANYVAKYISEVDYLFEYSNINRKLSSEIYILLEIKLNRISGCESRNSYAYNILNDIKRIERIIDDIEANQGNILEKDELKYFDKERKNLIKDTKLFAGIMNWT